MIICSYLSFVFFIQGNITSGIYCLNLILGLTRHVINNKISIISHCIYHGFFEVFRKKGHWNKQGSGGLLRRYNIRFLKKANVIMRIHYCLKCKVGIWYLKNNEKIIFTLILCRSYRKKSPKRVKIMQFVSKSKINFK